MFKAGDQVPLIPLIEVVGKAVRASPLQIGAITTKVGIVLELTVIVNVVEAAHCPAVGVKVYNVVAVLLIAGDHDPLIPLMDVIGNAESGSPLQIGATTANVGIILGLTVIANVVIVAHCPVFGVKVYKVVAVLFIDGDHVPLIPLMDVVDKVARGSPLQIVATAANVGVLLGLTTIVKVAIVEH